MCTSAVGGVLSRLYTRRQERSSATNRKDERVGCHVNKNMSANFLCHVGDLVTPAVYADARHVADNIVLLNKNITGSWYNS